MSKDFGSEAADYAAAQDRGNFSSGGFSSGDSGQPYDPNTDFQLMARQRRAAQLANARSARAEALAKQQRALTQAFSGFNDDYYDDLDSAYREFAGSGLQSSYDDALRGIYQGFKSQGLLTQGQLDAAISGLEAQKDAELGKIDKAAAAYVQAQRDAIDKKQKSLGEQLSAMAGGASDADQVNAQTNAIRNLNFAFDAEKVGKPGKKESMEFFQDFSKVGAGTVPNVAPTTSNSGGLGSELVNIGRQDGAFTSQGVQSPFQGRSLKVIG